MLDNLKGGIIRRVIEKQLPSILRDVAAIVGSWLAAAGIATGSVESALAGGVLIAFGLLTKFIDRIDGDGNVGVNLWNAIIGDKVGDLSNSVSRWLILVLAGALGGMSPDFDWNQAMSGDVVTLIIAILTFIAQRILKTK